MMKESAQIAHTYARRFLEQLVAKQQPTASSGSSSSSSEVWHGAKAASPSSDYFAEHAIHVHVPAGG